jgi:hypothetical protein
MENGWLQQQQQKWQKRRRSKNDPILCFTLSMVDSKAKKKRVFSNLSKHYGYYTQKGMDVKVENL